MNIALKDKLKKYNTKQARQGVAIIAVALFVVNALFDIQVSPRFQWGARASVAPSSETSVSSASEPASYERVVLPPGGVELPVVWGDLGKRMVSAGVIDAQKFASLYAGRGGMTAQEESLLYGGDNGRLKIDSENAGFLLNMLWALGLGNKNDILDKGPMRDERYGGDPSRFASTGGWTLAAGGPMDHYSAHPFVELTSDQQKRVERVSQGVYRPCCGNSVYFPDCNHGMAMLGLLELMASQDMSEEDMFEAALVVNAYWFPDTYLTIAKYLEKNGKSWEKVSPQEILGAEYSSGAGYRRVLSAVTPAQSSSGGGGCGV